MPNTFVVLSLYIAVVVSGCDDRPPLPETNNIDQAIDESVGNTADAAQTQHDSVKDNTLKMKKRLDPDAG